MRRKPAAKKHTKAAAPAAKAVQSAAKPQHEVAAYTTLEEVSMVGALLIGTF
jgi:hypothetical protein